MKARRRSLIVNADDFGHCHGINRGVIEAYEHGIVTSASVMVRGAAVRAAAAYGRTHPDLSLGLHVDLGEWAYDHGEWRALYAVVPPGDREAVLADIQRQVEIFRELVGGDPTHLDSHQHVHFDEPVRSILSKVACQLAVPLRSVSSGINHCGAFHGQSRKGLPCHDMVGVDALIGILADLPEGLSELGCHPGFDADGHSTYGIERAIEVETLCHPRVREALEEQEIELCSFRTARMGTER